MRWVWLGGRQGVRETSLVTGGRSVGERCDARAAGAREESAGLELYVVWRWRLRAAAAARERRMAGGREWRWGEMVEKEGKGCDLPTEVAGRRTSKSLQSPSDPAATLRDACCSGHLCAMNHDRTYTGIGTEKRIAFDRRCSINSTPSLSTIRLADPPTTSVKTLPGNTPATLSTVTSNPAPATMAQTRQN